MRIKKVIFKNCYGEEITFTRHFPLYVEKIDTFGYSGRFNSDKLIDSPGQFTSSFDVSGKVMPAEFAFWDRYGDSQTLKKIERVFTPLKTGLLTVFDTDDMIYRIDAYPTAAPAFQRTGRVIRWSVNFSADYPYWRKGYKMKTYTLRSSLTTVVHNPSMVKVPVEIVFEGYNDARTFANRTTGESFRINAYTDSDIIVNTKDFSVTSPSATNINQVLYNQDNIDKVDLIPGDNNIELPQSSSQPDVIVRFWELTAGVI